MRFRVRFRSPDSLWFSKLGRLRTGRKGARPGSPFLSAASSPGWRIGNLDAGLARVADHSDPRLVSGGQVMVASETQSTPALGRIRQTYPARGALSLLVSMLPRPGLRHRTRSGRPQCRHGTHSVRLWGRRLGAADGRRFGCSALPRGACRPEPAREARSTSRPIRRGPADYRIFR